MQLNTDKTEEISIESYVIYKQTSINKADFDTILNETSTEAKLSLSSNKLSSISQNENVELKIELNNNSENSDLYQNPKFEIELPKEISDIEIKDANILFDEELQIENISKPVKKWKNYNINQTKRNTK